MVALTRARAWLVAIRPRTLTAIVAPVVMGIALAVVDGVFALVPALAALLGGVLIQIGTNIANDYYDFRKGADTANRVGSVRVTQAGLLPPEQVRLGMWVAFAMATAVGAYLVAVAGWPVLAIGIASIAAGVAYTAGPVPIGYLGLGDLFTFVFFGPVAVAGTYYVQAHTLTGPALVAGVGAGALVTAILVVNNLRDIETDAAAGKRTLAVRIGPTWTRVEYILLCVAGAAVPIVGWRAGLWSAPVLVALTAFLLVPAPLRAVLTAHDPRALNPALGLTALIVGVYGIGFALGLVAS